MIHPVSMVSRLVSFFGRSGHFLRRVHRGYHERVRVCPSRVDAVAKWTGPQRSARPRTAATVPLAPGS